MGQRSDAVTDCFGVESRRPIRHQLMTALGAQSCRQWGNARGVIGGTGLATTPLA